MTARSSELLTCDVAIIGAGPAGTTAAALLAERGRRVVILERERFPRYRIGESLIPFCWFPLDRLGLVEKVDQSGFSVPKHSVQFVGLDGQRSTPFYFFQHYDHDSARTWQVVRSEFDQMLLDNAVEKGAEVRQETAARDLIWEDGAVVGVRAREADGRELEVRAPLTLDASGRDLFAQNRNRWRVTDATLKKIAIWTYFEGATRDDGYDAGATTIAYLPDKGWFWYIPLPNDVTSVGVVADREYLYREGRDPEAIFARELAEQPWVEKRVRAAQKTRPCQVTGDYSYRSKHCAADGLVLVGDAFAFLDPVFSSGVFLALQSGVLVADAAEEALAAGDVSAARFEEYGKHFCQGIEAMRRLVYAFYDTAFSFGDFLRAHPDFRGDLTDCLIGNVYKDLEPLFAAMGEFAQVPQPLAHGGPRVSG